MRQLQTTSCFHEAQGKIGGKENSLSEIGRGQMPRAHQPGERRGLILLARNILEGFSSRDPIRYLHEMKNRQEGLRLEGTDTVRRSTS